MVAADAWPNRRDHPHVHVDIGATGHATVDYQFDTAAHSFATAQSHEELGVAQWNLCV